MAFYDGVTLTGVTCVLYLPVFDEQLSIYGTIGSCRPTSSYWSLTLSAIRRWSWEVL